MRKKDIHLEILKTTITALEDLSEELVFLGGSTISLFITEPEVVRIRETQDVDCVVEVSSRSEYEKISSKLRKKGFHEDTDSKVICRFKHNELILDVMPTDPKILGFTNKWYKQGIAEAETINVFGKTIKAFSPPYLIASKIEAFKGRGKGNFMTSPDIEDIVTLIDGRAEIANDLIAAPAEVRHELKKEFTSLIQNPKFLDSLDAHISDRMNLNGRKQIVLDRINKFLAK